MLWRRWERVSEGLSFADLVPQSCRMGEGAEPHEDVRKACPLREAAGEAGAPGEEQGLGWAGLWAGRRM